MRGHGDKGMRGRRRGSRALDRIRVLFSGGHVLVLRRLTAVALALLAGMLAVHPRPGPAADGNAALTVARDLPPGHVLTPEDVAVRRIPAKLLPRGSLHDTADATGQVLAGAVRTGEVLTDARLVGTELTALTTGESDHASVPVRLAEPEIATLLHPGEKVDIVTAEGAGEGHVLADGVPVIAVRPPHEQHERRPLVLVGLPRSQAAEVAAASVTESLTVTLR